MIILSNINTSLISFHKTYHLPHLALELVIAGSDALADGDLITLSLPTHSYTVTAFVFKPNDGTRFILKNFKVVYTVEEKPTFLQKLLRFCFKDKIQTWGRTPEEISKDILKFFQDAGDTALINGTLVKPIF